MRALVVSRLRRFGNTDSGAVAIVFAVVCTVVVGAGALAVDYGMAVRRKTQMQGLTDAAALAGGTALMTSQSGEAIARANAFMNAKGAPGGTFSTTVDMSRMRVMVRMEDKGYKAFHGVLGAVTPTIVALSEVEVLPGANACLIALDQNAPIGIDFSLGGSVTAIDCAIWSNSTTARSIDANGSGMVRASATCAAGAIAKGSLAFTPEPRSGCPQIKDPLASWSPPATPPCTFTNFNLPSTGAVTISPGVYCGGFKVNGSIQVHMQPGVYVVKDGGLKVNGGATLTGTGVTIISTGADASIDMSGSAKIQIAAPTSGANKGLLLVSGRGEPVTDSKIGGGANLDLEGSIYLPSHNLSFGGNSSASIPQGFAVMIAKTLRFLGGATVTLQAEPAAAGALPNYDARSAQGLRMIK